MGNKLVTICGSVLAVGILVLFFQNCGKSGFESEELDTSSTVADAKITSAPFPWDASVNFITHMSCPNVNQYRDNSSPYFTFRVAAGEVEAYRKIQAAYGIKNQDISDAGLAFRPEFLDYMDKTFNRTTTHATSEVIQSVLTSHPTYQNAQLQLTFRKDGYLDQWGQRSDGSNIVSNLMDRLGSADFAKASADQSTAMLNFFPVRTESKRNLRGQVVAAPPNFDDTTFNLTMATQFYLHLGFSDNNQQSSTGLTINGLGPVANSQSRLYGRGYRFSFGPPNDAVMKNIVTGDATTQPLRKATLNPNLGLSKTSITEWDTSTAGGPTQITASWGCFSYAIVRLRDAARCPRENYSQINRTELEIIRKTLPADEWDVNTTLKCIVPTTYTQNSGSCYINNSDNSTSEPAYPMYFGNPDDLVTNPNMLAYNQSLQVGNSTYRANDYADTYLNNGVTTYYPRTGVEYRYYTHTCAQSRERQCVNFASFCYRRK
jgi:hypothetical protein